jgi:hypothetical protein
MSDMSSVVDAVIVLLGVLAVLMLGIGGLSSEAPRIRSAGSRPMASFHERNGSKAA